MNGFRLSKEASDNHQVYSTHHSIISSVEMFYYALFSITKEHIFLSFKTLSPGCIPSRSHLVTLSFHSYFSIQESKGNYDYDYSK